MELGPGSVSQFGSGPGSALGPRLELDPESRLGPGSKMVIESLVSDSIERDREPDRGKGSDRAVVTHDRTPSLQRDKEGEGGRGEGEAESNNMKKKGGGVVGK